jgi:hypothetical protein
LDWNQSRSLRGVILLYLCLNIEGFRAHTRESLLTRLSTQCALSLRGYLVVDELSYKHWFTDLLKVRPNLGRAHVDSVAEIPKLGMIHRAVPYLR